MGAVFNPAFRDWSCNLVTHFCRDYSYPQHEKTCFQRFVNNKGADQPAHLRSLISAFVIHLLESIICRLVTGEIPIF